MNFSAADKDKAIQFGDFISKHAQWSLSTSEAIILTKYLSWYNEIVQKIDAHILEVERVAEVRQNEPHT